MNNRNVPVKKGHADLDTPERIRDFHRKLATGWEEEYQEYRQLWADLPKSRKVRDYPLLVDLELASICNLNCPMCPRAMSHYRTVVDEGCMDVALAKRIITEIAGKVFALRLSLVGESTLHPNFLEVLRFAKEKGIREVSFLTNGSTLDLEFFRKVVEAGADWITISVDGIDNEYEAIRRPLKFSEILGKLQAIKRFKDEHHLIKPVLRVQGVWPAIRPNPARYYELLAPLADLVSYSPLIDYLKKDTLDEVVYEEEFSCPQIFQRIVICSDGRSKLCSADEERSFIVGDANVETIHQIWHGKPLTDVRTAHGIEDGFKSITACAWCYYPRKTEDNEQAKVGERTIRIENYINRKQIIGK